LEKGGHGEDLACWFCLVKLINRIIHCQEKPVCIAEENILFYQVKPWCLEPVNQKYAQSLPNLETCLKPIRITFISKSPIGPHFAIRNALLQIIFYQILFGNFELILKNFIYFKMLSYLLYRYYYIVQSFILANWCHILESIGNREF
jgi:hypothetical protein